MIQKRYYVERLCGKLSVICAVGDAGPIRVELTGFHKPFLEARFVSLGQWLSETSENPEEAKKAYAEKWFSEVERLSRELRNAKDEFKCASEFLKGVE